VAGSDGTEENVVGQTSGWVLGYSPEYREFETNPQLLQTVAALTGGQDLVGLETAVFDHTLPTEATTRPIWTWLTLAAVLLLPLDIAVRRLVITRRDWERAWAASFGRLQPDAVAPIPRTEQVSRLFEAKKRAEKTAPKPDESPQPVIIIKEKEPAEKRPFPAKSSSSTAKSTLASRLLEKKRQNGDDV
jgi:hypothetical protein